MKNTRSLAAALFALLVVSIATFNNIQCNGTAEPQEPHPLDSGTKPNELNMTQAQDTGVIAHEDVSEDGFTDIEPSEFARSNGTETHDPEFEYDEDALIVGR